MGELYRKVIRRRFWWLADRLQRRRKWVVSVSACDCIRRKLNKRYYEELVSEMVAENRGLTYTLGHYQKRPSLSFPFLASAFAPFFVFK